jgi:alginate O-acetyltransferase complex protein AlgI
VPLGGNRKGPARRYLNLFLTMLLGGLWHGAAWTFVIWGALHGIYLTLNHLWREQIVPRMAFTLPRWLSTLIWGAFTFIAVVIAWVIFRAHDLSQAGVILNAMFGVAYRPITFFDVTHGQLFPTSGMPGSFFAKMLLVSFLWVWLLPNSTKVRFIKGSNLLVFLQAAIALFFICLAVDQFGSYSPFLYFQF